MSVQLINDFMIQGPKMAAGENVLDAIHALYFLPENFKLILAGSDNADQSFYNEAVFLIKRDELGDRVQFGYYIKSPNAVIMQDDSTLADNAVFGDSAEALASAILNVARANA